MENNQTEQIQTWQAPELKVVDVSDQTLAGTSVNNDGITSS
jgi:hypothetical protein